MLFMPIAVLGGFLISDLLDLSGSFILNESLSLLGGYNSSFLGFGSRPTTLDGSLTVTGGNSHAMTVDIQGKLLVKDGSLRVRRVMVKP